MMTWDMISPWRASDGAVRKNRPLSSTVERPGEVAEGEIITIPFGIASFRMAAYALWPFGKTVVHKPGAGVGSALGNIIWFLVAGLWLAIGHLTTAAAQAITIVGIPLAIANIKMIPVTCVPLGNEIVDSDHVPYGSQTVYSF